MPNARDQKTNAQSPKGNPPNLHPPDPPTPATPVAEQPPRTVSDPDSIDRLCRAPGMSWPYRHPLARWLAAVILTVYVVARTSLEPPARSIPGKRGCHASPSLAAQTKPGSTATPWNAIRSIASDILGDAVAQTPGVPETSVAAGSEMPAAHKHPGVSRYESMMVNLAPARSFVVAFGAVSRPDL
ncbi:hypothetical protein ASPBRDRAFT_195926 [Aspergillus brasiliensis CBS 101740]|uniref:Uncharacterized protein n=1 Tax=Aspergillus brasiliensis (strain CBS 101740 / IMI 381727 / IBT 21946) TaxID=767769 RepID=A0A1L9UJC1_ASPBC|nr:hypothetical protein ASPBRDRAFT_195926 [Aspergillus brasiliensis CBS 101740]